MIFFSFQVVFLTQSWKWGFARAQSSLCSLSITFFARKLSPSVELSPPGEISCVLPTPSKNKEYFARSTIKYSRTRWNISVKVGSKWRSCSKLYNWRLEQNQNTQLVSSLTTKQDKSKLLTKWVQEYTDFISLFLNHFTGKRKFYTFTR